MSHSRTAKIRAIAVLGSPLIIVIALLLGWPLGILFLRSISDTEGFFLERYVEILTSAYYLKSIGLTAAISVASTILALIICVPAGLYLHRDKSRLSSFMAAALTIPLSLPGIIIGFFIILTAGNAGVIPKLIEAGTGERAFQIAYTLVGLLLGYLYFQIPRVVLVVRGAAAGVKPEVIDAARSLGASTWTIYTKIILPTLRPALVSASLVAIATGFGAYGTAATLSRGIRVMPVEVASAFTESFNPEMASTLAITLALITTTLLVILSRWGETKVLR